MEEDEHAVDPPPASLPVVVVRTPARVFGSMKPVPASTFCARIDPELWIKPFVLYARRIRVAKEQWTVELLPLLDDGPFRGVID